MLVDSNILVIKESVHQNYKILFWSLNSSGIELCRFVQVLPYISATMKYKIFCETGNVNKGSRG